MSGKKNKSQHINLCLSNTAFEILVKKSEEAKLTPSGFIDKLLREKAVTYAELVQGVMNYGWTMDKRLE